MKILVVSDNHGYFKELQQVIEKETPFDMLLHCGDICGELHMALDYNAPFTVHAVQGNCDRPGVFPPCEVIDVPSHRILLEHGHMLGIKIGYDRIVKKAKENGCDIALYGHSHVPGIEEQDGVYLLNPGSVVEPRTEDARPSYGIIEIDDITGNFTGEIRYFR